MNFFNYRIVALLGLGLFSAGCYADSRDEETAIASTQEALPRGHVISNGLRPSDYQNTRTAVDKVMQLPLFVGGALNTDPDFGTLLNSEAGTAVFGYAVQCAIASGVPVGSVVGAGIMATSTGWLSAPLNAQQRRDIHTCITLRLNPFGEHVNLWIGGPDTSQDDETGVYGLFEAVWSVSTPGDGTDAVYTVWPGDAMLQHTDCAERPERMETEFLTRVCDFTPKLCSVSIRYDRATACTGTPGGGDWMCLGMPAVETRLSENDWETMHTSCKYIK